MKLMIDIDEDVRIAITRMGLLRIPVEMQKKVDKAIQHGIPHETVTEFADRCRECGKMRTGHWKAKSFHELYCDNCGFDFDIMRNDFIDNMKYCPNCGVRMIGERNEK